MEASTMAGGAAGAMAKKKSGEELKLVAVKIERDIMTRARMIAAERGLPLASYLSDSLRGVVDRDWANMVRRAGKGGDE
jgi:hypothetical protein